MSFGTHACVPKFTLLSSNSRANRQTAGNSITPHILSSKAVYPRIYISCMGTQRTTVHVHCSKFATFPGVASDAQVDEKTTYLVYNPASSDDAPEQMDIYVWSIFDSFAEVNLSTPNIQGPNSYSEIAYTRVYQRTPSVITFPADFAVRESIFPNKERMFAKCTFLANRLSITDILLTSFQVSGTGEGANNTLLIKSQQPNSAQAADPITVVVRGGTSSCYGTSVLPVEALGSRYYVMCAGYSLHEETCQVRVFVRCHNCFEKILTDYASAKFSKCTKNMTKNRNAVVYMLYGLMRNRITKTFIATMHCKLVH